MTTSPAFERTAKRRKGFPSETRVKRGLRSIKGGQIELLERLGRNDPCPCHSGKRFRKCCLSSGRFRWDDATRLLAVSALGQRSASLHRPSQRLTFQLRPDHLQHLGMIIIPPAQFIRAQQAYIHQRLVNRRKR